MLNRKIENTLFVEKYRPSSLDGYVGNDSVKEKIARYLKDGDVPHLLLYGPPGTGKTTLGKIIAKELDCALLYINASDENGVDAIRTKIKKFAAGASFSRWKIIILDEADAITFQGQQALRNIMETYSKTTRFILTCNYVEKIEDAIKSRCTMYQIFPPSKKKIALHLAEICGKENIEYTPQELAVIINKNYPDVRSMLNSIQQFSKDGKLELDSASIIEVQYMEKVLEVLKGSASAQSQYNDIRQILADSKLRTFEDLYRYLFDNIDEYAPEGRKASIILKIAEGMNNDYMAVDKEINVIAMIIKIISEIKKG